MNTVVYQNNLNRQQGLIKNVNRLANINLSGLVLDYLPN